MTDANHAYVRRILDAAAAGNTAAGRAAVKEWTADFLRRYPDATVTDLSKELTLLLTAASRAGQIVTVDNEV